MCALVRPVLATALPALARHRQSEEAVQRPRVRGPGRGRVRLLSRAGHQHPPSATCHTRSCAGCVSRRAGVPPANPEPVVCTEHSPLATPAVTARVSSGQGRCERS